ncbi:HelD family protein [Micromonospora yangpuensis]|uniref:DNA helicase IV n=1 Tax=Micromonospora yangpuensis TaxID=683228 RepID=A0A1C6U9I2_9ACTN|nr:UvrD-helicase domain-containing protein [Micromonospora yangpuensis]GGL88178.1 DNA helicase [Micromonospora yangpuensis]SCL50750.1 DNA helicase IV [Micromonospora yangpuensis]
MSREADIASEQAYFDAAAKHRDRRRDDLRQLPSAAAHTGAAAHLRRYAETARRALGSAGEAVAFGRVDAETGETRYVGRHLIRDADGGVLVVNWHAPAAAGWFEATPDNPAGVRRKRAFTCTGNTIEDITDTIMAEIAEAVDAQLLAELTRGRTGSMRDIVATIQAAQFALIRAPRDQVLVIEGGPGTGKSAVALHRVSWLLFQHRADMAAADVLVVGPHPTFVRYIGQVLPALGDEGVELRDVGRLAPDVPRGRTERDAVARIKGAARMAGLLARALDARIGAPDPAERLLVGGRFVTLPGVEVAEALAAARAAALPYAGRRQLLRDRLAALVAARTGVDPAGADAVGNLVERLWPQQNPTGFLRDLLGSTARLRAAAADEFTSAEVAALHRRGADRLSRETWSAADLSLLDELAYLIDGPGRRYAHVVVDEAQDLSPMQLRAVARRSATGSLTVVGDLAQSTGSWARDSWDEVLAHLPTGHPARITPLRYGYRVPRQAYATAVPLLSVAAPGTAPVEVVRDGPAETGVHRVGLAELAGRAVTVAREHAEAGRFVGVVCPPRQRRPVEAALAANGMTWSSADRGELGGAVNLISPQEAKGLEFDAVVVVEPEEIVASDERGHRLLYVALTRTTGYLDIVCTGDPVPLDAPARPRPPVDDEPDAAFTRREAHRLAEHLAGQLRGAAPPAFWDDILTQVRATLRPTDPVSSGPADAVSPGQPQAAVSPGQPADD